MSKTITMKKCPMCGHQLHLYEKEPIVMNAQGVEITIPSATYYHCAWCFEEIYDLKTAEKLERLIKKARTKSGT